MMQNEGDCNLSSESISSNLDQVNASHSTHDGTACRPFIMDASKLDIRQLFITEHDASTYPDAISAPRQVGAIKRYKNRRLGLQYQGTLSCCASLETIASLLSSAA